MLNRAWTACLALCLFLGLASTAAAQSNYRIVDVEVVGNRVATTSLVLGVSALDKGSPLSPQAIQQTLTRLYGLGIFSDVRLEAEEVSGGLKVYIVVKELPKLAALEFSGNNEINAKDLKEKLALGVGGYISPFLIHDKAETIRKLYQDKGFFRASAKPTLTYNADSTEASLAYAIDEKSKVKVENVVMTGNVRVPSEKLIGKMRNRKRGFLKSSNFAEEKYDEDLQKVIDEYHKKGYVDAYMISDSTSIDSVTNQMTVYLNVYEGPLYYFGKPTFEGTDVLKPELLTRTLKFTGGEVFNIETYDKSISELYAAYSEIGHLHVRIDDERTTRADSILDIKYVVTEGLPSHINLVHIVGNTKTKDKVIRRELTTYPGQVFNRSLLIRSVRDVMALNYFENVEPSPLDLPNGDIDLEYRIKEKQTGQISAGAGYNSQDKLVGSLGLGLPNFRGNGQDVSFNIDFGSKRNSFQLSFTEPWFMNRPTLLGLDAFLLNRRWYDEYTEGREGGSVRLGRRLRWPDNYFRISGVYRLERNKYYDFSDNFKVNNSYVENYYYGSTMTVIDGDTTYTAGPTSSLVVVTKGDLPGSVVSYKEKWNTASQVGFTISRDSRNLPEFATKGSQVIYSAEFTGGPLGGFWKYSKHTLSVAKFIPLVWKFALAAKVQYGMVTSGSGDDRILVSDRFTPGGTGYDGVIRGYDDGAITPDTIVPPTSITYYIADTTGNPAYLHPDSAFHSTNTGEFYTRVRGKYMLVGNFELQFPIVERTIYGLMFYDAGGSWLHARDIKPFSNLYRGVGFGFRIAVPGIGTLGFDFGHPLDSFRGSDRKWKPHFQIGTTFR